MGMASAKRPAAIRSFARRDLSARSSDWAPAEIAARKKRGRAKPCLTLRSCTLELESHAEPDLPLTGRAGDLHEVRRAYRCAGPAEMRCVREVEELGPELDLLLFLDREYAEDAQVRIP